MGANTCSLARVHVLFVYPRIFDGVKASEIWQKSVVLSQGGDTIYCIVHSLRFWKLCQNFSYLFWLN